MLSPRKKTNVQKSRSSDPNEGNPSDYFKEVGFRNRSYLTSQRSFEQLLKKSFKNLTKLNRGSISSPSSESIHLQSHHSLTTAACNTVLVEHASMTFDEIRQKYDYTHPVVETLVIRKKVNNDESRQNLDGVHRRISVWPINVMISELTGY